MTVVSFFSFRYATEQWVLSLTSPGARGRRQVSDCCVYVHPNLRGKEEEGEGEQGKCGRREHEVDLLRKVNGSYPQRAAAKKKEEKILFFLFHFSC